MKKFYLILSTVIIVALAGCEMPQPSQIQQQQDQKIEQANKVMEQTKVPSINKSLERENIRQRILVSNDPNTLQWIYPMSAGRVIGRFPVKGKVTSGGKRLTSNQIGDWHGNSGSYTYSLTEAPDEMGTYGSSGDYIFWFDPAGRIHQFRGDYFVSTVPYKIDSGFGTISVEVDQSEDSKRATYDKQIQDSNKSSTNKTDETQQQQASSQQNQSIANKEGGK